MGVQDTYRIVYQTEVNQAISDNQRYQQEIRTSIKLTEELKTLMKGLGRDTTDLKAYTAVLAALTRGLGDAGNRAAKADHALDRVGANNAQVAALTAQVQALAKALADAEARAKGIPKVGGGGAPGAPGGGLPGIVGFGGKAAVGTAFVGFAGKILAASREAFSQAEQTQLGRVAKAEQLRHDVQPLVPLTGRKVGDDSLMEEVLKLSEATGMSPTDAAKFSEIFLGATGAGTSKFAASGGREGMSEETAKKLLPHAAAFAQRTGIDPEVAGAMIGSAATFFPIKDENEAMNIFGQIEGHLNLGGRGSIRDLSKPYLSLMADFAGPGGRIPDPVRVAATYAASSNEAGTPAKAASKLGRANRGLRKLGETGKFGVTPEMDYVQGIAQLHKSLAGMNVTQQTRAIYQAGVHEMTEVEAMIGQAELVPLVDQYMKDPKVKAMGTGAIDLNKGHLGSPAGRTAVGKAKLDASEIRQGMKGEGYVAAFAEAEAELVAQNRLDTPRMNFGGWLEDVTSGYWSSPGTHARRAKIDARLNQNLQDRAVKAGVSTGQLLSMYSTADGSNSDDIGTRQEAYGRNIAAIEAAEKTKQAADKLDKVADKLGDALNSAPRGGSLPGVVPLRN